MTSQRRIWVRNLVVAGVIGVALGAVRLGRMSGRATGGEPQAGCGGEAVQTGSTRQAIGYTGTNDLDPNAIDSEALKRANTDAYNITTPSIADPAQLCGGTIGASSCTLTQDWQAWISVNPNLRKSLMKAIVKCSQPSGYKVNHPDGTQFSGQWGLYPTWRSGRLVGQDKRERMSSCILSLLNGNNYSLNLCLIGPGGSPFSDACSDPIIDLREGGFFGDLFAANPTAYVVGPQSDMVGSGRICGTDANSYCCPEDPDLAAGCSHKIIKAGAFGGPNGRCKAKAMAGSFEYCTEFFSTREPGRVYSNVFTSFVPSGT